ncbi:hypothetical protein G6F65_023105 [Rhizopus arrhizus]|nr:hypothetical protein G6F65_023105 [Rhizopus arrhizus]
MVTTSRALAANGLIQTRLDNLIELKSQCIKIGTYRGVDTICRGSRADEDDLKEAEGEAQDKRETEDCDQTRGKDRHGPSALRRKESFLKDTNTP